MAQLTITIPDAQVDRVKAAFAERLDLDVADVDAEAIRQELVSLVKTIVLHYEQREAGRAAEDAVVEVDAS